MKIIRSLFFLTLILLAAFATSAWSSGKEILCASTTSIENSGLFAYLLPFFEKETGIKVRVVARGTGAAIEMGKRGDSDVVFVHAKEQEIAAVEDGYFVNRHDVMYNDFIVIGPKENVAEMRGAKTATEAFKKIASSSKPFVSRGDNSGTHAKELSIWKKTGIAPKGNSWYLEVGQGMEKTQRIANEKRAYTLTDRGTWLATKDKDNLDMVIVLEGDPALFNQYGVMAVNPKMQPHVKYADATRFIDWVISKHGQELIGSFKDKHGNQLFTPNGR